MASCKFRKISCSKQQYGCRVSWRSIQRESVDFNVRGEDLHLAKIQLHIKQDCSLVIMACPNGCGAKISREDASTEGVVTEFTFILPVANHGNA